jgi:hypothetical protein
LAGIIQAAIDKATEDGFEHGYVMAREDIRNGRVPNPAMAGRQKWERFGLLIMCHGKPIGTACDVEDAKAIIAAHNKVDFQ